MVLMMSPRVPISRKVCSAMGDIFQRPLWVSVASPMRSSLRARSIINAVLAEHIGHVIVGA
jgi:hypothetical protein